MKSFLGSPVEISGCTVGLTMSSHNVPIRLVFNWDRNGNS